jgi:hypothetical protein
MYGLHYNSNNTIDTVAIDSSQVLDWWLVDHNKIYGGFTSFIKHNKFTRKQIEELCNTKSGSNVISEDFIELSKTLPVPGFKHNPASIDSLPPKLRAISIQLGGKLHYPAFAIDMGLQGQIYARIEVKAGQVQKATILRGIGGGCDEEVLRAVSDNSLWSNVTDSDAYYILPAKFVLL